MVETDIYSSVLDYMCENFDYSLYATDFNAKEVSLLQRSIASLPTPANSNRMVATKAALQDFFNAIFQKVFVYEDEERLKIVKYFDKGAINEGEDKQIHTLRQELVTCKDDVEDTFIKGFLYMFEKSTRKRFEMTLFSLNEIPQKDVLREQIYIVYDLNPRDIVIFLNGKLFLKKFMLKTGLHVETQNQIDILYDKRFVDSLWEEVNLKLQGSFENGFEFLKYSSKEFYEKYPSKLFLLVKLVVKNSFGDISEKDLLSYTNIAFKNYLPMMLKEIAEYIFKEVIDGELRAIKFLKLYSESTKILNNKMKLNKAPLMNKKGKIYNYQNIHTLLKKKELLESKISHKKIELKNIHVRVKKSLLIVQRSEDEMELIQKRRLELLLAIERVEDEINSLETMKSSNNLDINRLEFSKRDLLEAFKQVEIRSKTQTNILKNSHKELEKWEEKRIQKNNLKESLFKDQMIITKEYVQICEILATALGKEPLEL